jgi:anti-anti-sigma factor
MSTKLSPVTALAQLRIDTSCPLPATARVAVVGEVDLATAPGLRDRLLSVLHEQNPAVLDVDLAGVTFLDCTGIGALVAVRNAAVHEGCQVRVCHPQPITRRVLEVTGLLDAFTVEPQQLPKGPQHPPGPVPEVTAPRRLMVAA